MWKIWNDEVSIITDPFTDIGYKIPLNETCDIILSSHDHFDHNNFSLIRGNPEIVNASGKFKIKGIEIETFPVWHDENSGRERGRNLLMKFTVSGKNFLHCGDLGHILDDEIIEKLGKIDVVFIPVGGFYTIDAETAKKIVDKLNPKIIFPMHYKTEVLNFPIAEKERYLNLIENFRKIDENTITLKESDFSQKQAIIMNYE